ncbi:GpE family phage tail protein [Pseudomonas azotoformans]
MFSMTLGELIRWRHHAIKRSDAESE